MPKRKSQDARSTSDRMRSEYIPLLETAGVLTIKQTNMKTYRTQRGVITTTVPYGQLSMEERQAVMITFVESGRQAAMKKHNVAYHTIHHIKFHNPDILREAQKAVATPMAALKERGYNSREVAKKLDWPIEKVNKLWEYV